MPISLCLSLSVSLSLSLSLFPSIILDLYCSLSFYLSLSLPLYRSLSFFLSFSLSIHISNTISLNFFPFLFIHFYFVIFPLLGLGTMNAIGYFKEDSRDKLIINVTTSDQTQLNNWSKLRLQYPEIMSTCVTNDWVVQSIRAQKRFSRLYEFIGTNTLILCADPDKEVSAYM